MKAQWDTGYLIWMIILISVAAICWITAAAAGAFYFLKGSKDSYGNTISGPLAGSAVIAALIVGLIGTFIAFPFSTQYHRYVPKSGAVAKIGYRFLASDTQGGGTTQKYVITFSNGQSYGCLDTRCAEIAVGDDLTLMCERAFQFNVAYPGWDCNWGIDRKRNGQVIP